MIQEDKVAEKVAESAAKDAKRVQKKILLMQRRPARPRNGSKSKIHHSQMYFSLAIDVICEEGWSLEGNKGRETKSMECIPGTMCLIDLVQCAPALTKIVIKLFDVAVTISGFQHETIRKETCSTWIMGQKQDEKYEEYRSQNASHAFFNDTLRTTILFNFLDEKIAKQ